MKVDAALLDKRWRYFRWLVDQAAAEAHDGRFERAAVLAELAAHHATWQHHGAFASPDLERVIGDIARRGLGAAPALAGRERRSGVLHVTSMVSGLAGLQHMIVRWIGADRDQEHSVALTRPELGVGPAASRRGHSFERRRVPPDP